MAERSKGNVDIEKVDASLELKGGVELGELSVSTLDGVVYSMNQRIAEGGADAPILEAMIPAVQAGELRFPVIPKTVMRVQELMRNADVSVNDLAFTVSLDPALATKVVGVANSAFYCGADSIRSVRDAIMRLGTREATNVAIAVAMRSSLFKVPGFESDARSIWHHSLLVARLNETILGDRPPFHDMAFLMGLVLELGRIVVLAFEAQLSRRGKGWAPGAIVLDPPIAQALEDFGISELMGPAIVTSAQEDFGGLTSLV